MVEGFHFAFAILVAVGGNQPDGIGGAVGAADGQVARLFQIRTACGVRTEVNVVGGGDFADGCNMGLDDEGEAVVGQDASAIGWVGSAITLSLPA